jgi:hypothetical protein
MLIEQYSERLFRKVALSQREKPFRPVNREFFFLKSQLRRIMFQELSA